MNNADQNSPIEILLVEDDPGDVLLTKEALSGSKLIHELTVVDNGEEALRYLRRESPHTAASRPSSDPRSTCPAWTDGNCSG